jgi:hypothetical protein
MTGSGDICYEAEANRVLVLFFYSHSDGGGIFAMRLIKISRVTKISILLGLPQWNCRNGIAAMEWDGGLYLFSRFPTLQKSKVIPMKSFKASVSWSESKPSLALFLHLRKAFACLRQYPDKL